MKTLLFIYNLQAGKGRARARIADFLATFTRAGWLVTAYPTQGVADATAIATAYGAHYDRIVACGGDGTLHETIAGLMALQPAQRPPVGYLPAGTTNDFARNLHLPRGFQRLAETAAAGVTAPCDVGQFNDRFFLYVAAFGIFTDVSYDTPQSLKNMFGHLAYLLEGATRLASLQSYQIRAEHDGGVLQGDYIFGMVSNTVSVGGFLGLPAAQVQLDDGRFEVVLIRKPNSSAELQSILRALMQMTAGDDGMVTALHTARLEITCAEGLAWSLDGEYGGAPRVVQITNCTHAVEIVHGT